MTQPGHRGLVVPLDEARAQTRAAREEGEPLRAQRDRLGSENEELRRQQREGARESPSVENLRSQLADRAQVEQNLRAELHVLRQGETLHCPSVAGVVQPGPSSRWT